MHSKQLMEMLCVLNNGNSAFIALSTIFPVRIPEFKLDMYSLNAKSDSSELSDKLDANSSNFCLLYSSISTNKQIISIHKTPNRKKKEFEC